MGLFGSPKIDGLELQRCLTCFEAETRVMTFQTKEADLYNNAMVKYLNSIKENPEAAREAVKAAQRLSQSAAEVLRRHENIKNVPDAASAMHYAWHVTYLATIAWASATLAAIESMANGMNPNAQYVQQVVGEYQKAWQKAKDEDKKFLKQLRVSAEDIAKMVERATTIDSTDDWEPILSDSQKEGALALIRHLQTMLVYQQLAMETYNDAVAYDTGEIPNGAEIMGHFHVTLSDPTHVAKYILPAIEKKIEIINLMEALHKNASSLAPESFIRPYQDMTLLIIFMKTRAFYIRSRFKQFINNEVMHDYNTEYDERELSSMDNAIKSLNELIYNKIGLSSDEWLDIVHESFNSVRASVNLMPLSKDVFRSRYIRGTNGEHVRFFSD